jgi:hypothetical protein
VKVRGKARADDKNKKRTCQDCSALPAHSLRALGACAHQSEDKVSRRAANVANPMPSPDHPSDRAPTRSTSPATLSGHTANPRQGGPLADQSRARKRDTQADPGRHGSPWRRALRMRTSQRLFRRDNGTLVTQPSVPVPIAKAPDRPTRSNCRALLAPIVTDSHHRRSLSYDRPGAEGSAAARGSRTWRGVRV